MKVSMQREAMDGPNTVDVAIRRRPATRLPFVVYALAACTFLMLTTEFVVAGLLPEIAAELQVSVARAGLLITVFAIGMIVGALAMALLTRRMPRRVVLMLALAVFAAGHVVVALGSSFPLLLTGRRCIVEPADALNPRRVGGQIAWASSVNAAATRIIGGTSTASS
jgi:MFS family permease